MRANRALFFPPGLCDGMHLHLCGFLLALFCYSFSTFLREGLSFSNMRIAITILREIRNPNDQLWRNCFRGYVSHRACGLATELLREFLVQACAEGGLVV